MKTVYLDQLHWIEISKAIHGLTVRDGTTTMRTTPVQVAALGNNVAEVWLGDLNSCALKTDGTVWCWGENGLGQLGVGDWTNRSTPTPVVGLTNVSTIRLDQTHACALKTDGTVWCWGGNDPASCFASACAGTVGDGTGVDRNTPVAVDTSTGLTTAKAISVSFNISCAIKTDDTVWCWGGNTHGQVGDGASGNFYLSPRQVTGLTNASEITAADHAACAKKTDGTIWCWGRNNHGQLGDGTLVNRLTPGQVLNFP